MNSFAPRNIEALKNSSSHGLKLYTISCTADPVETAKFWGRLEEIMEQRGLGPNTAGFAILHEGDTMPYLVVAWWENENELFTSVSIQREGRGWLEDPEYYSFCLWDLEVIWHERNSFIRHCYSGKRDLAAYRGDLLETRGSLPHQLRAEP